MGYFSENGPREVLRDDQSYQWHLKCATMLPYLLASHPSLLGRSSLTWPAAAAGTTTAASVATWCHGKNIPAPSSALILSFKIPPRQLVLIIIRRTGA